MKKYLLLIVCIVCSAVNAPLSAKSNKQTVVLSCDLHCQGCCDKVMKNIAWEKGVKDLQCDLKTKTVTLTYDADKTDLKTLLAAFEKIGKPAKIKETKSAKSVSVQSAKTDAETGASQQY